MEDLSDRELERYLQENNAAKWFCDFGLLDKTPNYSVFSKFRKNIGTRFMSKVFDDLRNQLKQHGLISEIFSFVDASHLISKANLWKEQDKAIQEKYEKLNNEVLHKVAKDTQARIGCKGGNKFWYGYKKHASVDIVNPIVLCTFMRSSTMLIIIAYKIFKSLFKSLILALAITIIFLITAIRATIFFFHFRQVYCKKFQAFHYS